MILYKLLRGWVLDSVYWVLVDLVQPPLGQGVMCWVLVDHFQPPLGLVVGCWVLGVGY